MNTVSFVGGRTAGHVGSVVDKLILFLAEGVVVLT